MSNHNYAIWASKNTGKGFTLRILPSPPYPLTKSLKSNIQNILDFRDWSLMKVSIYATSVKVILK